MLQNILKGLAVVIGGLLVAAAVTMVIHEVLTRKKMLEVARKRKAKKILVEKIQKEMGSAPVVDIGLRNAAGKNFETLRITAEDGIADDIYEGLQLTV